MTAQLLAGCALDAAGGLAGQGAASGTGGAAMDASVDGALDVSTGGAGGFDGGASGADAGDAVMGDTWPEGASEDVVVDGPADAPGDIDAGPLLTVLSVGDGRAYYATDGHGELAVDTWDGESSTWNAEAPRPVAVDGVKWVVAEHAPFGDEELVGIVSDTGATCRLEVHRWTGAGWNLEWSTTDIPVEQCGKRGFDLAYEQNSGDALVVYADGDEKPSFRAREGGVWKAAATVPVGTPAVNAGAVHWVELESRFGTDQLAVAYADADSKLVAMRWGGGGWNAPTVSKLEDNLKRNPVTGQVSNRAFDLAFEELSGDLVVAWGRDGVDGFHASVLPKGATSWTGVTAIAAPASGVPHFVDLASEPNGNRIAGGFFDMGDGTERLGLATWDGASWVDYGEFDSQTLDVNDEAVGEFHGSVGWLGTSGTAICVYPDDDDNKLDWARWTGSLGWSVESDVNVGGKRHSRSVLLRGFRSEAAALVLVSNEMGALHGFAFDGSQWLTQELAKGLTSSDSVPFALLLSPK